MIGGNERGVLEKDSREQNGEVGAGVWSYTAL